MVCEDHHKRGLLFCLTLDRLQNGPVGPEVFQHQLLPLRAVEEGQEGVVVALQNAVVFVVVPSSTTDGQAQEHVGRRRNDVIHLVHTVFQSSQRGLFHVVVVARSVPAEPGCRPGFLCCVRQLITGN